ncbi:MAG: hypothetical protein JXR97_09835 [Planctomycetes bacterium]|nr:hypothetical protein [Planctomycetota bacterium]
MSADWQVSKSTCVCSATQKQIEVGETYYSALIEENEGFSRKDYSVEAWNDIDKSDFFSFWKTKVKAEDEKKKLVIDVEAFYTFFANLMEKQNESKILFSYLVTLILVRKRILRLDEIEKGPDGDALMVYDRRADKTFRVDCPEVSDEQLEEAQKSLNEIFECTIGSDDL